MKSIIIPHNHTEENKNLTTLSKIQLLTAQLNTHSLIENTIILTLYNIFKNNPIPINSKTQQNLKLDIIQIIQQYSDNQNIKFKEPTLSAINNAIWKLVKKGLIREIDGLYFLQPCFKDIDQVEQIVFRFT